jgi:hypothetical protein
VAIIENKNIKFSQMEVMPTLRKCEYCRGKDGKQKDIYETIQDAIETAKFIEVERGIFLNVYECPYKNGWHLTKNNAESNIHERQISIFKNNNIPIKSNGEILWEFEQEEINKEDENTILENNEHKKINKKPDPIKKIECTNEKYEIVIHGKIMEIIENINIEKTFKINTENVFAYNLLKPNLVGIINQITVYVKNNETIESYTILIQKELLLKYKIKKENIIKTKIINKNINNVNKWVCNKILS